MRWGCGRCRAGLLTLECRPMPRHCQDARSEFRSRAASDGHGLRQHKSRVASLTASPSSILWLEPLGDWQVVADVIDAYNKRSDTKSIGNN